MGRRELLVIKVKRAFQGLLGKRANQAFLASGESKVSDNCPVLSLQTTCLFSPILFCTMKMCTGLPGPKGLDGLDGLKGQKGFTGTPGTVFQEFMDIFSLCAMLKHIEYNTSTGIYH